jgi:predicted transposase YbfD/YdcC
MAKKNPNNLHRLVELVKLIKTTVHDPRVQGRSKHLLIDIIVITICAVLCAAESVSEIEDFAVERESWLRKYLQLPNGIPSHDTFSRVLSIVDTKQMQIAFSRWTLAQGVVRTKSISLDGKCSKGTERSFNRGKQALKIVSAYAHDLGLSLVESSVEGGSEIDAALACLELLDLKGILVQVDAGIGVHRVVSEVRNKRGDYLVPLKSNQWHSRDEVETCLEKRKSRLNTAQTEDEGAHGRDERRSCALLTIGKMSETFQTQWPDAKTIFSVTRERVEDDKRYVIQQTGEDKKQSYRLNNNDLKYSVEVIHYVSSRKLNAAQALKEVRSHWGIENKVHWVLDVAFREDNWAVRSKSLAQKLSLIRKIAFNIVRQTPGKGGIRRRMKRASWNVEHLESMIFNF